METEGSFNESLGRLLIIQIPCLNEEETLP